MEVDESREGVEVAYHKSITAKAAAAAAAATPAPNEQQEGQKAASRIFPVPAAEAVMAS